MPLGSFFPVGVWVGWPIARVAWVDGLVGGLVDGLFDLFGLIRCFKRAIFVAGGCGLDSVSQPVRKANVKLPVGNQSTCF